MTTILVILLVLVLVVPHWPYSAGWGYGPSGLIGAVLVVLLVMLLLGAV